MHSKFEDALRQLLEKNGEQLTQVKAIWYDNFNKEEKKEKIGAINFLTRPSTKSLKLPQLCEPREYGDEYEDCKLVSLVAWDHFSKPGNDYWVGGRDTDDGVKAAATGTMSALTGLKGVYDKNTFKYKNEDSPNSNWNQCAEEGFKLKLSNDNFNCYPIGVKTSLSKSQEEARNPTEQINSSASTQPVDFKANFTQPQEEAGNLIEQINSPVSTQPVEFKANFTKLQEEAGNPIEQINSSISTQPVDSSQSEEESSFFSRPSSGRDLLVGAAIGLLVVAVIAVVFVATGVAFPGIAAATLGLIVIGVFSGIAASVGEITRRLENEPPAETEQKLNSKSSTAVISKGLGNSSNEKPVAAEPKIDSKQFGVVTDEAKKNSTQPVLQKSEEIASPVSRANEILTEPNLEGANTSKGTDTEDTTQLRRC